MLQVQVTETLTRSAKFIFVPTSEAILNLTPLATLPLPTQLAL